MIILEDAVEIRILHKQGKSIRKIVEETGKARNTVRKYLKNDSVPRYKKRAIKEPKLDAYKPYLIKRVDELIKEVKAKLFDQKILPRSNLRKALGYFCGLIPHLKNYTKKANARLENNVAERAIRPLALGRKNWLFVESEKGGEAAAILFSLVQSCKGIGVNPQEYLEDVMRRLMSHSSQKLYELLPDHWAKIRQSTTKT
ncbi:MAG: hypothetical protein K940chlam8_01229 [Chlamydiae bacterium]|nr:hypothetical protein [Chlamydiota bacterium]